MRICDICKKKPADQYEFNYKFQIVPHDKDDPFREGGTIIDLCVDCVISVKSCNLVDVISNGINESKIEKILDYFNMSKEETFTGRNIISIIKDI